MPATRLMITVAAAAATLALASCGADDDEAPPPQTVQPTETASPSPEEATPGEAPTDNAPVPPDDALPGADTELGPAAGDRLIPVGVAHDDVLHVRDAPGADSGAVGQLQPVDTGITATGHNRQLDDSSVWAEIEVPDEQIIGWSSTEYLGYIGDAVDITADFPDGWTGESVWQLAEQVIAARYEDHEDYEDLSFVLIADAVEVPGASDALIDVLEFADHAVRGDRVSVRGTATDEGYLLERVAVTPLCWRGVSQGLCS